MTYILILFAAAFVVAAFFWVRQLRGQARQLRGGLASFNQRLEDERQKAALTRPKGGAGQDDGPRRR